MAPCRARPPMTALSCCTVAARLPPTSPLPFSSTPGGHRGYFSRSHFSFHTQSCGFPVALLSRAHAARTECDGCGAVCSGSIWLAGMQHAVAGQRDVNLHHSLVGQCWGGMDRRLGRANRHVTEPAWRCQSPPGVAVCQSPAQPSSAIPLAGRWPTTSNHAANALEGALGAGNSEQLVLTARQARVPKHVISRPALTLISNARRAWTRWGCSSSSCDTRRRSRKPTSGRRARSSARASPHPPPTVPGPRSPMQSSTAAGPRCGQPSQQPLAAAALLRPPSHVPCAPAVVS